MKLSDLNNTLGNRDSTSGVRLSDYAYGGVNIPDVKLNADTGLTTASSKKLSTFTNILGQLTALELTNVTFGNSDFNVGVDTSGSVDVTFTFNHTLNGPLGVLPTSSGSAPIHAQLYNLSTNVGSTIVPTGYIGQSSASRSVSVPVSFSISDESLTSKYIQVDAEDYLSVGVSSFTKYLSFYADRYVYNLSWVQQEVGTVEIWSGYNQAYFSWGAYNAGNCTPPSYLTCTIGTNAKGCDTWKTAVHFDCGINCRHIDHGIESTIWNEGTNGAICGQDSWTGLKHTAGFGENCFTTTEANTFCYDTSYTYNLTAEAPGTWPANCTNNCVPLYHPAVPAVLGVTTNHPSYTGCYAGTAANYAWVCSQPTAICVPGYVCVPASNNDGYSGASATGYGCTAGYTYSSCVAALGPNAGCADCSVADTIDPCASTTWDACASTTYIQYSCTDNNCTITAEIPAWTDPCASTVTNCVDQIYTGVEALNPHKYPNSPGCQSCTGHTDKTCRSPFFNAAAGWPLDYDYHIYNMSTDALGSPSCSASDVEATGVSCATAANGCLVYDKCKWCIGSLISTTNDTIDLTTCTGPINTEATPSNVFSSSFTTIDAYEASQGWVSTEGKTLSWWFNTPNIANDYNPNIAANHSGIYAYDYNTDALSVVTMAKIIQYNYISGATTGSCLHDSYPGTIETNQSLTTSNATDLADINSWQTSTLITTAEQQLFANMQQYNLSSLQSEVVSALDGLVITPTLNSTDIGYQNIKSGSVSITLGAAGSN